MPNRTGDRKRRSRGILDGDALRTARDLHARPAPTVRGNALKPPTVSECVPRADLQGLRGLRMGSRQAGRPELDDRRSRRLFHFAIRRTCADDRLRGSRTPLEEPASYTLSCAGASDSVTVRNPRTMSLGATTYGLLPGESTSFVWNATCFDTCAFDRGIGKVALFRLDGSGPRAIAGSTYTLTAADEFGTQTMSVTLVYRRPDATFAASPATLKIGERATLAWTSNGAESCSIEPDIGQVPANGSIEVAPGRNTEYTLSAAGPGGTTTRTADDNLCKADGFDPGGSRTPGGSRPDLDPDMGLFQRRHLLCRSGDRRGRAGREHRGQPDANHHLRHHRRRSGRDRERLRHRCIRLRPK